MNTIFSIKELKRKMTRRTACDNCEKVNPEILKREDGYKRATKCCAYGENQSAGKIRSQRLKFPFKIYWTGFWVWV